MCCSTLQNIEVVLVRNQGQMYYSLARSPLRLPGSADIICFIFLSLFYPSNPLINCQAKPSQIKPGFYRKSYQEEPTVTSRAVRTCSISEELKEKLRSEHDVVKMLKWSKIGNVVPFRHIQPLQRVGKPTNKQTSKQPNNDIYQCICM